MTGASQTVGVVGVMESTRQDKCVVPRCQAMFVRVEGRGKRTPQGKAKKKQGNAREKRREQGRVEGKGKESPNVNHIYRISKGLR